MIIVHMRKKMAENRKTNIVEAGDIALVDKKLYSAEKRGDVEV